MSLHWDLSQCIGPWKGSHVITHATWTIYMHHTCCFGHCMHAHAFFSPLGPHVGVFNALERLITHYKGDYTWWLGPYDDVEPSLDVLSRSTYRDKPTRASWDDIIAWITHTCGGDIIPFLGHFYTFRQFPGSRRLIRGCWCYWTIFYLLLDHFLGHCHHFLGVHLS
jgi:hypothetical protein